MDVAGVAVEVCVAAIVALECCHQLSGAEVAEPNCREVRADQRAPVVGAKVAAALRVALICFAHEATDERHHTGGINLSFPLAAQRPCRQRERSVGPLLGAALLATGLRVAEADLG